MNRVIGNYSAPVYYIWLNQYKYSNNEQCTNDHERPWSPLISSEVKRIWRKRLLKVNDWILKTVTNSAQYCVWFIMIFCPYMMCTVICFLCIWIKHYFYIFKQNKYFKTTTSDWVCLENISPLIISLNLHQ